jgi:hypothetical protein
MPGSAGLTLQATTPYGRHWTSRDLDPGTRTLADPEGLLDVGDVVGVHDRATDDLLSLLRVDSREGDLVRLRRVRRTG